MRCRRPTSMMYTLLSPVDLGDSLLQHSGKVSNLLYHPYITPSPTPYFQSIVFDRIFEPPTMAVNCVHKRAAHFIFFFIWSVCWHRKDGRAPSMPVSMVAVTFTPFEKFVCFYFGTISIMCLL